MANGIRAAWRRWRPALALGTALLALIPAMAAADGPHQTPPGWKGVAYDHAWLAVPARWAVHDLAAQPWVCARADVPGIYLGHQGASASCPARALGHGDTVRMEPLDDSVQQFSAQATENVTIAGIPMRVNPDPEVARSVIAAVDDAGLLIRVDYGDDASFPNQVLATLSVVAAGPSPTHKSRRAPAVPKPHATSGVFTGSGFDTCSAPSADTMRQWLGPSPYRAVGVYVGGTNAACLGGNLNPSWVHTVTGMGWHLIPIYVGLQAPCANQTSMASIDAAHADTQGVQNADDAMTNLRALGMGPGSPVFFDMEAYQQDCAGVVTAFLTGWVRELRAKGYLSGVYSGIDTGITFILGTQSAWPDEIWFARWDGTGTTSDPEIPDGLWTTHQRLKQYQGDHPETYGSAALNVDSNVVDATLVGHAPS